MTPDLEPWQLLRQGIPLTLLLDLLDPDGPDSDEIYASEPQTADWLPRRSAAA